MAKVKTDLTEARALLKGRVLIVRDHYMHVNNQDEKQLSVGRWPRSLQFNFQHLVINKQLLCIGDGPFKDNSIRPCPLYHRLSIQNIRSFYKQMLIVLACSQGKYGSNCRDTCSNCKRETCSPVTGVCQYDCRPGWKGGNCNQDMTQCIQYINGVFSVQEKPKNRYQELTGYKHITRASLALKIYLPEYKDTCCLYLNFYQNIDNQSMCINYENEV